MSSLSLRQVSKTFAGAVHAVRDVSLEVADGEFLVLVGPSGCGKSTLLRMIAGLEKASGGEICIGDRVVNTVAPKDRDVAMVFQNYALYPHMTVYKNMAFGLRMRKVPKDEIDRTVRRTADLLGITELLDRKPGALSGGQQQRVAVGRAIVREPSCFLFDEPLSNLDARLRVQMRAELKALHHRLRTTTVYVTHDQEEAMTLGDRVVVMCSGVVQQVGRPLEVYRRPTNSFVAGFVGSPPMNLLPGRIDGDAAFDNAAGVRWSPRNGRSLPSASDVVLGVRPEAVRVHADANDGVAMTVTVCEPVGDRMDVRGITPDGTELVARIPATDSIEPDQQVHLEFVDEEVHFFDRGEFGARL